jgi:hypothetical protein
VELVFETGDVLDYGLALLAGLGCCLGHVLFDI